MYHGASASLIFLSLASMFIVKYNKINLTYKFPQFENVYNNNRKSTIIQKVDYHKILINKI